MKENIPEELLRDYLKGKLTPSDRENLEHLLRDNPELAQTLALLRTEMAASELLIASETRELFKEWQAQKTPRRGFSDKKSGLWWIAFVALLLFVPAAVWLFNRPDAALPEQNENPAPPQEAPVPEQKPTPEKSPVMPEVQPPVATIPPETTVATVRKSQTNRALATQFLPDPLLSKYRRSPTDTVLSTFNRAQEAYEAGDYRLTLELLAQTDSTRLQSATFLSAHALFHLQRFEEAEAGFMRLVQLDSRQYRYLSEWGALMCRLANSPKREPIFRQQLNGILANAAHPYHEQAKALEKELHKKQ